MIGGTHGRHSSTALNLAAAFLRVEPFALKNALLFRVLNTGGQGAKKMSTYNVPQNVEQASSARDALAKTIYSRMFDWIVTKVNEALQKNGGTSDDNNMIGVLDIFGFEIFEVQMLHALFLRRFLTDIPCGLAIKTEQRFRAVLYQLCERETPAVLYRIDTEG